MLELQNCVTTDPQHKQGQYRIKKLTLLKALSITHCSITLQKKSEKILTKQGKDFTLLGCYTVYVGSDLLMLQDRPQRPQGIHLGMLHIPEEGRPELHSDGSLTSCKEQLNSKPTTHQMQVCK
jgi:hypothetical protein